MEVKIVNSEPIKTKLVKKPKKKANLIIEEDEDNGENIQDIFKLNEMYIKSYINDEYIIDIIKNNYSKVNDNSNKNIYNFIYSYINGLKMIHQNYKIFDYSNYNLIKENKDIKILWGNCLEKLKTFPNEYS